MVKVRDDKAVMYVNYEASFGSLRIVNVTGGVGRRCGGYCKTELEVRIEGQQQRQESRMFPKSYYCWLYKRMSKERRKGNPPTPTNQSLYTFSSATL